MTQNLHDLLTISKLGNPLSNNTATSTGEMASMQQQYQHEMEIKLLREERNSLSESIAQMQVERRKFSEEKLNLEKDKMDLERERNKLRELESNFRIKSQQIEEIRQVDQSKLKILKNQRKTLTSSYSYLCVHLFWTDFIYFVQMSEKEKRDAIQLNADTECRQKDLERERTKLRDNWQLLEDKLKSQESSFQHEKMELDRERQFLERLRSEMLCSSCLNPITMGRNNDFFRAHQSSNNNPHPLRSEGDGLDVTRIEALSNEDKEYFKNESQYLDQLYAKQFH